MGIQAQTVWLSTFRLEGQALNGLFGVGNGTICKERDIHALGSHGLDAVNSDDKEKGPRGFKVRTTPRVFAESNY